LQNLRIIGRFIQASFQEETAYHTNFFFSLLNSGLGLITGLMGILILFGQTNIVNGWDQASTMAILGVYLIINALRGIFINPGLDSLAGMDGEIWTGRFDFSLLRPVNTQFLITFRKWKLFTIFDLLLGFGVLIAASIQLGVALDPSHIFTFILSLFIGVVILYAILLIFASLVFWSPDVMFSWIFDGFFQLGRYPIGLYPGWIQFVFIWIIPIGVITTFPAQALKGTLTMTNVFISLVIAVILVATATILFRIGLRRYSSASG